MFVFLRGTRVHNTWCVSVPASVSHCSNLRHGTPLPVHLMPLLWYALLWNSLWGGWRACSFVACLSHLTIDHASLSRRSSTVPTPSRHLQLRELIAFFHILHSKTLLTLYPPCFAFWGHHLSPRIDIVPSESSRRDVSKRPPCLASTLFQLWISSTENRPTGVWYTVVIRLSLGRRLVNHLPVAQRTNAFTNGVDSRTWVVGREFESHVHHENAF